MNSCRICRNESVERLVDFGAQPISNRFLKSSTQEESLFPLLLGRCKTCGTLQLIDPIKSEELLPPYEWISYKEPEAHLDQMVQTAIALPGITKESLIGALSSKDDSTLDRFRHLGFSGTWRLDSKKHLGIAGRSAGVESIQSHLTLARVEKILEDLEPCDLLIMRHILEHVSDMSGFVQAVKKLIKPNGYALFEVPDADRFLRLFDYSSIWEEHVTYFSSNTLRGFFPLNGFKLHSLKTYPYALEDSLVGIAQCENDPFSSYFPKTAHLEEGFRDEAYAAYFPTCRMKIRSCLSAYHRENRKMAILGAGHQACMFINLFGIADLIEFVVDDNPSKQNLFMPGSRLSILPSTALVQNDISLCLLGIGPEVEKRVIEKNAAFTDKGGTFLSINPASNYALRF